MKKNKPKSRAGNTLSPEKLTALTNRARTARAWRAAQHGKAAELTGEVEDFMKALSSRAYEIPATIKGYITSEAEALGEAAIPPLAPDLVGTILRAVADGDAPKLRSISAAVADVHKRIDPDVNGLVIRPKKPVLAAALESIGASELKSGEEINQDVWQKSGTTISERHARRLAAKLGKPPKNKGGCGTHRP